MNQIQHAASIAKHNDRLSADIIHTTAATASPNMSANPYAVEHDSTPTEWHAVQYWLSCGRWVSTGKIGWLIPLTTKEACVYRAMVDAGIELDSSPMFDVVLARAIVDIRAKEKEGEDIRDEYVGICTGEAEMPPENINALVADRDPYVLSYFGLEQLSDAELDAWDAFELESLPKIKSFIPGFEPYEATSKAWTLKVEHIDPNI